MIYIYNKAHGLFGQKFAQLGKHFWFGFQTKKKSGSLLHRIKGFLRASHNPGLCSIALYWTAHLTLRTDTEHWTQHIADLTVAGWTQDAQEVLIASNHFFQGTLIAHQCLDYSKLCVQCTVCNIKYTIKPNFKIIKQWSTTKHMTIYWQNFTY